MKPNSLCLLTKRGAGVQEASRRIIGAFMVGEDFFGADCRSGTVAAHPVHRVALRPEKGLAFWPYFTRDPEKQRWGKTALKCFPTKLPKKFSLICRGWQTPPCLPQNRACIRRRNVL